MTTRERFRQTLSDQRSSPTRSRFRKPDFGHPVGLALSFDARKKAICPFEHLLCGLGLGRLGPHLLRLGLEGGGLPGGVGELALAAALVGLPLRQICLPADVVDIDHRAVGVEVEDPVHHGVEEVHVVADDDQAALVGLEEVAQPGDGVGVQVVRRLVQEQGVGAGEENPGQLHPSPLAS
jgi:hypothetical protein